MMVESLIIEDDLFRLFLIPIRTPSKEWINFRVKSVSKVRGRLKRSRLAYSKFQKRLSENKSTQVFRENNPEGLNHVVALIETAIETGLV
jgi:hypothetical protein